MKHIKLWADRVLVAITIVFMALIVVTTIYAPLSFLLGWS